MAKHDNTTALYAALFGNLAIAITKFIAAFITGGSAMLSEGVHSLVDCGNEVLLLYGQKRAAKPPDAEHPVVRTHPETGEKILFVNAFTTHIVNYHTPDNVRFGIDYAPGAGDLLRYLISQATIPEYQVRWRWTKNSVAIWDNRSTQHYAVQDYWPAVRRMERAGIVGDPTF